MGELSHVTHPDAMARKPDFAYECHMAPLQHLALTAGRALALLAALMVALVPVLPAHAHMHRTDSLGFHAGIHASHEHGSAERAAQRADVDDDACIPQNAGDCCFVSHVPVIPTASLVPVPYPVVRDVVRAAEPDLPPDVLPEALPEPPRPFA